MTPTKNVLEMATMKNEFVIKTLKLDGRLYWLTLQMV